MPSKPIAAVVCDYWVPRKSANSVCVEKILPLLAEKYDIRLITCDENVVEGDFAKIAVGDIPINKALADSKGHMFKSAAIKFVNKFNVVCHLPIYPIRSRKWANRYGKAIEELLKSGEVALIVAVCFPGESIEACLKLKKNYPSVRFVAYFLDEVAVGMYRKNTCLRNLTSYAAACFEHRAIAELDGAIFLSSSRALVERNHSALLGKIQFTDVPLLSEDRVVYKCDIHADRVVNILYAGTLANPDRNPSDFISLVRSVFDPGEVHLHFAGDAAGLLDGYDDIDKLGFLPPPECDIQMRQSDILLSIGNMDPNLIPSKLFKYMSIGKPIIHLKRGERDSCLPYLARYPLALVLDEGKSGAALAIKEFIRCLPKKNGLEISLGELFPMAYPAYTVRAFETVGLNHQIVEEEINNG